MAPSSRNNSSNSTNYFFWLKCLAALALASLFMTLLLKPAVIVAAVVIMSLTTPAGFLLPLALVLSLALFINALNRPTNPRSITVSAPFFDLCARSLPFFASASSAYVPGRTAHVHPASGNRVHSVGSSSFFPSAIQAHVPGRTAHVHPASGNRVHSVRERVL